MIKPVWANSNSDDLSKMGFGLYIRFWLLVKPTISPTNVIGYLFYIKVDMADKKTHTMHEGFKKKV